MGREVGTVDQKGKKTRKPGMAPPLPSSSDLRGRQSVRATFKLSERAIDALSIVATHLGIKQKSLFDHLIDDIRSLRLVAREIELDHFRRLNRVQKTYVLSRKALSSLEEACQRFDAPRDALVEYSVQRLLPVIDEEREKHRSRAAMLQEISGYVRDGKKLLKKTRSVLGEDDPVFASLKAAMDACETANSSIRSFVEKGNIIEDF
jgi:hypothetical protein